MRIKFNTTTTYEQNNKADSRVYEQGKEYDVTDDHGQRWIRRGVAVEVPTMPAKPEPLRRVEVGPAEVKKMVPVPEIKVEVKGK